MESTQLIIEDDTESHPILSCVWFHRFDLVGAAPAFTGMPMRILVLLLTTLSICKLSYAAATISGFASLMRGLFGCIGLGNVCFSPELYETSFAYMVYNEELYALSNDRNITDRYEAGLKLKSIKEYLESENSIPMVDKEKLLINL